MKNTIFHWLVRAIVVAAVLTPGIIIFVFSDRAAHARGMPPPGVAPRPMAAFVGVMIGGLALATIVASLAELWYASMCKGLPPSPGRRSFVWLLVWFVTLILWGSVWGQNHHTPDGELANDGSTWWTDGGILGYLSVTSHQAAPGAEWSHELSIHPWPLIGTVALSLAVVVVAVLIAGWRRIGNQGALRVSRITNG
jgi:hypothetical protein